MFPDAKIAVVGDFFLDKYLDIDPGLAEVSLETGKSANQVVGIRKSPGAAGNVVSNLAALDAGRVFAVGFTGDDGEGYDLRKALQCTKCDCSSLLVSNDSFTPTYLKPRDISRSGLLGELERFDTKNRRPLARKMEDSIIESVQRVMQQVDAVIAVDQADEEDCGVLTARVREAICNMAASQPCKVFWADSRHRCRLFENIIIKCNRAEALAAAGTEDILSAGKALSELTSRPVFLTLGEHGVMVFDNRGYQHLGAVQVQGQVDPTGAGDSATAGAVLSLASGASLAEAALIANMVASITVQEIGTTGMASRQMLPEVLEKVLSAGGTSAPTVFHYYD